jgi:hypothetical protein
MFFQQNVRTFLMDPCCSSFFFFFFFVLFCVFTFWVRCCDVRYNFSIKKMFGSSLPPVACRRAHVLFTLFVFVCIYWCPTHIVLCFCFVFLRLVAYVASFYGLSILVDPSVFSNVYYLFVGKWYSKSSKVTYAWWRLTLLYFYIECYHL